MNAALALATPPAPAAPPARRVLIPASMVCTAPKCGRPITRNAGDVYPFCAAHVMQLPHGIRTAIHAASDARHTIAGFRLYNLALTEARGYLKHGK